MSVDFHIEGEPFVEDQYNDCIHHFNLANGNARDLLAWLNLPHEDLCGSIKGTELAVICRRRLWDEPMNHDPAKETRTFNLPGCATIVDCGRDAGYLRERTKWLLQLAERAGERMVLFS